MALLLLVLTASPAFAVDSRSGDSVVVAADQVVEDDLIVSATMLRMLGHVRGDVIALASDVDIEGEIDGDLLVAGSSVTVGGTVHGSVRAVTQSLVITGSVGRNVTSFAQSANFSPSSQITGNVGVTGNQVDISGAIGRGLTVSGPTVTLHAHVSRDARITAPQGLTVGPDALIVGTLTYISDKNTHIPPETVPGGVNYVSIEESQKAASGHGASSIGGVLQLLWLLGNIVLGLLMTRFLPGLTRRACAAMIHRPFPCFGIGAALLLALPLCGLLAVFTVIGIPVGLLALAGWVGAVETGWIVAAGTVATAIMTQVQRTEPTAPRGLLVVAGLLVLFMLTRIPYLGPSLWLILLCMGMGAVLNGIRSPSTISGDTAR